MSLTFQDTSYTRNANGGNYALFSGDQTDLLGYGTQPVPGACSISVQDTGAYTFGSAFTISTNSTILNLLPDRNPTSVARFLQMASATDGAIRFGFAGITMTGVKRMALRWYSYHTADYQWNQDGTCTNGKIGHISQQDYGQGPLLTLTHNDSGSDGTKLYSFIDGVWNWRWAGHSGFDGFNGAPRPGSGMTVSQMRGKWWRHEIVVRRPRNTDSQAGGLGFDFSYFVRNITDNGTEIEDMRMSSGCNGCITGGNFVWNTGVYPTQDTDTLHTEFYRADNCTGTQGWVYAALATWTTDAGQRIGAASEVEGGTDGSTLSLMGQILQ